MNEAQVTMIGYVASMPRLVQTKGGRFVTRMRVGVTPRLQDRQTGQWSDGDTSYLTVTSWRSLAANVAACLRKGDPVVVKGRMRIREYEDKDGNQRVAVEVDASTIGHDLTRGVAHFLRTKRSPGDAPVAYAGQQENVAEIAGRSRAEWLDTTTDEPVAPEHSHEGGFSAADLFDDAGVEASSAVAPQSGEVGVGPRVEQTGDLAGSYGAQAPPERSQKAAA